jgi:type I restriction enzyme, S subunit
MSTKTKTTVPKEEATPVLVPKLRFPEFLDAPSWVGKPMGQVYSFKGNNSLSRDQLNYEVGSVKNIHYGDIHTKFSTLFDITKERVPFINPSESLEGLRPDNDCIEGDMIFADASEDLADIGKSIEIVRLNGERVVSGQHTILARPNDDSLAIGFGAYLFKSNHVRAQIQKESQGSKVLGISATRLTKIELPLPKPPEQQKIAECLSSVDELMAAQALKVDALKTHKKGLMQQLFPREGETQPRLRFPDFQNAGEWVEIELGEKVDLLSGYPFDGPDISQDSSGIRLLRGINVTEGRIRHSPEIDRYYTGLTDALEKFRLQINDLVIGMDGSKVGKNSALVSKSESGALLIQRVARLRAMNPALIQFIFQRINSAVFHSYVDRINTSSGIPHISAKQIKEFKICFPSAAEQKCIADFLCNLDNLITAETQKLEALKTHKKGLMQQLFPSPEAVAA